MAPAVICCTQKCCLFVAIRTRLAMAEPRESCLCGSAAWSTQGEAMGMSSFFSPWCLQMLSATGPTQS